MCIIPISVCLCLHPSSKLIFTNADKEDFGTYSVSVTNTEGVSSSHTITAEGMILAPVSKYVQKLSSDFYLQSFVFLIYTLLTDHLFLSTYFDTNCYHNYLYIVEIMINNTEYSFPSSVKALHANIFHALIMKI